MNRAFKGKQARPALLVRPAIKALLAQRVPIQLCPALLARQAQPAHKVCRVILAPLARKEFKENKVFKARLGRPGRQD